MRLLSIFLTVTWKPSMQTTQASPLNQSFPAVMERLWSGYGYVKTAVQTTIESGSKPPALAVLLLRE